MEIALIIIGILLILIGLVGCIAPILPGPPISYCGLLLLQWAKHPFSKQYLLVLLAVVVIVTVIDNVIPVIGTKLTGGSKYGTWGATIGLIIGFFLGPIGIIAGSFFGAFIGELIYCNNSNIAIKSAIGTFIGFIVGTGLKLAASGWITYEFFKMVF